MCDKKIWETYRVPEESLAEFPRDANERTTEMNFSSDNDPADSLEPTGEILNGGFHCYGESPPVVGFVPLAHNAPGGAPKWRTRNFMGRVKKRNDDGERGEGWRAGYKFS